jgi:uncharacterized protein YcbK (DUF882 family)
VSYLDSDGRWGMTPPAMRPALPLVAIALLLGAAAPAWGDVTHLVARGHTVEAIAHRYHVSVKAILDANHLKDPRHLKIGDTLTIPGVTPSVTPGSKAKGGPSVKGGAPTYAMRAKTPGVIHATRLATTEDFVIHASTRRGHISPNALESFERLMRSGGGLTHPIDPRLVALVTIVSDHFGGRHLEIISGFRPHTPTQYTAHSNHNIGHAIDFRVVGVPNEILRDYCKTLRNVGVGYYPNSTFVHLDSRTSPAFWIDYSRPGEPPRYNTPDVDADEGTSDVADDTHPPESSIPPEPTAPPGPTPLLPPQPDAAPSAIPTVSPEPGSNDTPDASPQKDKQ